MTALATPAATFSLAQQFCSLRQQSELLCAPLTPEDMMVQSCAEASPAKWHLAHTTWFFETFILRELDPAYRAFHPDFLWLFNSYYNSVSEQPEKKLRASFSRPLLKDILAYRQYVDAAMHKWLKASPPEEVERRAILGMHHEQQHQELLLTDIKHALWTNPLRPAYLELPFESLREEAAAMQWHEYPGGVAEIGHAGDGFCFDNELPRHRVYLEQFALASRLVTCAEYLAFIEDGGYRRSELWLSEGWQTVQADDWKAPLYWHQDKASGEWSVFTMRGEVPLKDLAATPVCHVSYFESAAYALWAESVFQLKPNGSLPHLMPQCAAGICLRTACCIQQLRRIRTVRSRCLAMCGSGREARIWGIRGFMHCPGLWVNITVNSCRIRWCCAAVHA